LGHENQGSIKKKAGEEDVEKWGKSALTLRKRQAKEKKRGKTEGTPGADGAPKETIDKRCTNGTLNQPPFTKGIGGGGT